MWKETRVVDQRVLFVAAVHRGEASMSELCASYGVSRKTGYKWLARAEAGQSLEDRSRRPLTSPQRLDDAFAELFLELRRKRPTWGPRKLLARLQALHRRVRVWPSASTVGKLLKDNGLIRAQRTRPRVEPYESPLTPMDEPNAVWCADFKGDFRTGDKRRVLPLTITDGASRYLLRCTALSHGDGVSVQEVFESAFREFGLPRVIRTDNGPPFATTGPGGLSKLAVWFFKLGIASERIQPGKPTQNGRHERMHRTLAEDAISPPAPTFEKQQRKFDVFRRVFNEERPHEALGMRAPFDVYEDSPRRFPTELREPTYPPHFLIRSVRSNGEIQFAGRKLFVSEALVSESVGIEERDDDSYAVFFGPKRIGGIDAETMKFDKNLTDE
jgi:putative transposase